MKWLEIVPQDVLFGRNCFHMGWRCSPVRGARWERWEGSLLPPHPSLQPFSALPQPAFLKPVFFLEGPSWWMFPSPLGRSSKPPLRTQLPRKLPPPAPGLHQACRGWAPSPAGAEALTGPWHIPLHKPLLPGAQKDSYKIFRSSPEPLLPSKLIGLKTNTGGVLPCPFLAFVSTLRSCFLL